MRLTARSGTHGKRVATARGGFPHMIRRALAILALIGLLLSVGLWFASYFGLRFGNRTSDIVAVKWGQFIWGNARNFQGPIGVDGAGGMKWQWDGFRGFATDWRLRIYLDQRPPYVGIPLWIPTIGLAALFAHTFPPIYRQRKRRQLGLCLLCGYNLTGNISGRCPECGTKLIESD